MGARKKVISKNVKVPFNSSIRSGVKADFIKMCQDMDLDKNELLEALLKEFMSQRLIDRKFR